MTTPPLRPRLLRRSTWPEVQRVTGALRTETVGGILLLVAAVVAIVWANSPWSEAYAALRDLRVGPASLHLDLTLAQWASDGLLAVFFFVAGVELKREFVVGDLADPAKAALPIAAALCGVALPAVLFAVTSQAVGPVGGDVLRGWAVPTATDIAFALAVLAVINTHLPSALRSFLLTLAVVDDLVAITIIALFYTDHLNVPALLLSLVPLALFGFLVHRRVDRWWLLVPVAFLAWALVHASGIHATVAGVTMGLLVPVRTGPRDGAGRHTLADRFEHRLRPFSAGFAVPVFAFMAAGVTVVGGGLGDALGDPAAIGVVVGLVLGKMLGVFGGTWGFARFTRAELDSDLAWADVFGLSLLAGIGFTVSLLIGELAYGPGSPRDEHIKLAVLAGSLTAAVVATVALRLRNRHYRLLCEAEEVDADHDGVPDVFASPSDRADGGPGR
ncbi:Na+/H+ antiporter NhaA [Oryzihumus leptocrescens]|uniref:Na(+)/H(+) antiporter NhaA n=1 Tax=Oryzihumus leptocrescens TaxID=297536 RepID=A0A542Z9U8_9MICO|nr:Na+/H+ antiporter NhaA [Oryzihumus leptocrescens]TQL57119.1 sodium/proton antiporter (NhaA family) [Oryzihumus leptocrescens]